MKKTRVESSSRIGVDSSSRMVDSSSRMVDSSSRMVDSSSRMAEGRKDEEKKKKKRKGLVGAIKVETEKPDGMGERSVRGRWIRGNRRR